MSFGISLLMVLPETAVSQTIVSFDEQKIVMPSAVYESPDPQTIEQAEIQVKAQQFGYCSCVQFAEKLTGYDKSVGTGRNWPTNTEIPLVGGVVVLNEGNVGHVAVITSVSPDSFTVVEANYIPCQEDTRTITINNPDIIGFWHN